MVLVWLVVLLMLMNMLLRFVAKVLRRRLMMGDFAQRRLDISNKVRHLIFICKQIVDGIRIVSFLNFSLNH